MFGEGMYAGIWKPPGGGGGMPALGGGGWPGAVGGGLRVAGWPCGEGIVGAGGMPMCGRCGTPGGGMGVPGSPCGGEGTCVCGVF